MKHLIIESFQIISKVMRMMMSYSAINERPSVWHEDYKRPSSLYYVQLSKASLYNTEAAQLIYKVKSEHSSFGTEDRVA